MFWLYFAAGFFAFPLVIVLLFLLFQRRTAAPTQIGSSHELQDHLRGLLEAGKDGQTLFIAWTAQRFEIRVCKRDRTSSEDTLWLEVRNSDANRRYYATVRDALKQHGFDVHELVTQARRQPKRFRIVWPGGGPVVVTGVSHAIQTVESALPSDPRTKRMVARHSVLYWLRSKRWPNSGGK